MSLTDIKYVKLLMKEYNINFKKKYGQNFLINPEVPDNIASECTENKNSGILEIGPGIGTMTQYLCEYYKKVVAVEIDTDLIGLLSVNMHPYSNFKVINDDIMKIDLNKLIEEEFSGMPVSVCANLPYYITTPILMKLLESNVKFDCITVMMQKEVADRICATAGKSEYGAVSAVVNYYARPEKLFDVTAENFIPAPKVDSTVIRLNLYKEPPVKVKSEKLLFKTIKGAFEQRRKTLSNALSGYFSEIPKSEITSIIESCGFKSDIRGEKLDIHGFALLSDALFDYGANS